MQSVTISSPPVAAIIQTSNNVSMYGYLKCNGSAVDRTIYSQLFAVIGTTYGAGNGSTTFNLPDYRGCFLRGLDESRGLDTGRTIGSYQADDNVIHSHSFAIFNTSSAVGQTTSPRTTSQNATTGSTGGNENRPKNHAVVYWIKF